MGGSWARLQRISVYWVGVIVKLKANEALGQNEDARVRCWTKAVVDQLASDAWVFWEIDGFFIKNLGESVYCSWFIAVGLHARIIVLENAICFYDWLFNVLSIARDERGVKRVLAILSTVNNNLSKLIHKLCDIKLWFLMHFSPIKLCKEPRIFWNNSVFVIIKWDSSWGAEGDTIKLWGNYRASEDWDEEDQERDQQQSGREHATSGTSWNGVLFTAFKVKSCFMSVWWS